MIAEGTHAHLLATEPRYAEILAQSDAVDDDVAVVADALIDTEIDADVTRSRVLDIDVGEMRDVD